MAVTGQPPAPTRADDIRALFNPGSIALVGASDKSGWSSNTFDNLRLHGFTGPVHLVNPRADTVHGQRAHRSLSALPGPVDLAYVMVPTGAVRSVLEDGARSGIRHYVVLTAGFGETGPAGMALERDLVGYATSNGLTVLGPNGNGFINAAAGVTAYGLPVPAPLLRGPVGVVLQSGALASAVLGFANARNLGLSLLTAVGNESMVGVADVLDYLVADESTKVIALFLEAVRQTAEFAAVARRALQAGKPIVALKVGRSRLASWVAQAHTGALVGDDAVVDAAFRQLGVVRVRSLEDLIITAGLLAHTGPVPGNRVGVVTPSGGACEIIADRAEDEGLQLPEFAPATTAALREICPPFATVHNPLDVTGYVVVDRTLLGRALDLVVEDPHIDVALLLAEPPRVVPADPQPIRQVYAENARRIANAAKPVVVMSTALADLTEFTRGLQAETGYPYIAGGVEHGVHALGLAVQWSRAYRRAREAGAPATVPPPVRLTGTPSGVWGEHRAGELLARNGVPVVPGRFVSDVDAAVAAAADLGYPVVLKAVVAGLAHKSDIGGVRLGLYSAGPVRQAYAEVTRAGAAVGEVRGVLVQPQRSRGIELLVGVVRDRDWGLTMAIGLGGIWVEVLRDSVLRLLPVDAAEVRHALAELRGADVLRGARGAPPADLDALAAMVARIGALAGGLGDRLQALEINPLLVDGARIEALDALVVWRD